MFQTGAWQGGCVRFWIETSGIQLHLRVTGIQDGGERGKIRKASDIYCQITAGHTAQ